MINISFDNPYLLLLALPLFGVVIASYCIAIGKENRTRHIVTSFILHLVMVACIVLSASGTVVTSVLTKTEVYAVADVSYSASANLDKVNKYIQTIDDELPRNAKLGVVCFGKDSELITPLGKEIKDVKTSTVDNSATDIVSALEYTATLFGDETIKRIVLITDGKQTGGDEASALVSAIEKLHAQNIQVDAMYLDDNISPSAKEVQISSVAYMQSTYLNHDATAEILLRSTYETSVVVSVERGGEPYKEIAQRLSVGFNTVKLDLFTTDRGAYDYKVTVQADGDELSYNNAYSFTQTVSSSMRVLLVSSDPADEQTIKALYGSKATVDAYINKSDVPFTVEQLCVYDEFVLSNFDVRTLDFPTTFLDSINTLTSRYGKSLLTFGDMHIQNQDDDETLQQLSNMLPVNYGNANQSAKFLSIVLDISSSMDTRGHFLMAKQAVVQLLELLEYDKDYIALTYFADKVYPKYGAKKFTEELKQEIIDAMNGRDADEANGIEAVKALETKHGTAIEAGLETGYSEIIGENLANLKLAQNRQVMLISDGLRFSGSTVDLAKMAEDNSAYGIATSTILTNSLELKPNDKEGTAEEKDGKQLLKDIATKGKGNAYHARTIQTLNNLILSDVADDLTESVIDGVSSEVITSRASDKTLKGGLETATFPSVTGYVNNYRKGGAITVLSAIYINKAGVSSEVPLYAYWKYGVGQVSSFSSTLSGAWTASFRNSTVGKTFLTNVFATNTPTQKVETPYLVNMQFDGIHATVTLTPAVVDLDATATVELTYPDGTTKTHEMTFYATEYFYKFSADTLGKYTVKVNYAYGSKQFPSEWSFYASYPTEYDRFTVFDAGDLYTALRNRGTVSENGEINLETVEGQESTYTIECTIPLIITAIVLYVVDIAVRKLKWSDIKGLFKRQKSNKGDK